MFRRALTFNIAALPFTLNPLLIFCDAASNNNNKKTPFDVLKTFDFSDPMKSLSKTTDELLKTDVVQQASIDAFKLLKEGIPSQIGYGFMMGFTSGYTVKKVSKVVSFVVGASFICLQGLSYNGFVTVNYDKLEKQASSYLDLNRDGNMDRTLCHSLNYTSIYIY